MEGFTGAVDIIGLVNESYTAFGLTGLPLNATGSGILFQSFASTGVDNDSPFYTENGFRTTIYYYQNKKLKNT